MNVPPLEKILFENDHNPESNLNVDRWKVLLWLLSIPETYLNSITSLAVEQRLIGVVLFYMVQVSEHKY